MATHRVTGNSTLLSNRENFFNQCRQFFDHIIVHVVVLTPRRLGSVQVKTCAFLVNSFLRPGVSETRLVIAHSEMARWST